MAATNVLFLVSGTNRFLTEIRTIRTFFGTGSLGLMDTKFTVGILVKWIRKGDLEDPSFQMVRKFRSVINHFAWFIWEVIRGFPSFQ